MLTVSWGDKIQNTELLRDISVQKITVENAEHSGVTSYETLGQMPPRLPTISFVVYFGVNLTAQLSKHCVVCEISWCRCQQLTALSISTALVTKLLVIEHLLHPALKSAVSAP